MRVAALAVMLALTLLGTPGCQHVGLADRRIDTRVATFQRTWSGFVRDEAQRPAGATRTLRTAQAEWVNSAARLERDRHELRRLWNADIERWNSRQPEYQRAAAELLRGQPERIEWLAIILFL